MVSRDEVEAAAARIAPFVHRTPVFTSHLVDEWAGATLFLKGEHLQRAGAFKYRGATNAVQSLANDVALRGVAAHSSGNHAAALALAARVRGVPAHVVMPTNAPAVKRAAVLGYGARIVDCEPTEAARIATLREVIAATGAIEIHPFDNDDVIAGAGTAALELLDEVPDLDVIVAPVGGGGLLSGTSLAAAGRALVYGAEPEGADDAARSLAVGTREPQLSPDTICDGLRTSLSDRTFAIVSRHVETIVTVPDHETLDALAMLRSRTKQVVEPSAAIAVAAVRRTAALRERRVGVILSGGNYDPPS
ncbi:MAG TPA: pyridoxal-phosphate dependent enzyme [Acidimicrobiia bacterium]